MFVSLFLTPGHKGSPFNYFDILYQRSSGEDEEENCIPYLQLYRILLLGSFLTWNCMFVEENEEEEEDALI